MTGHFQELPAPNMLLTAASFVGQYTPPEFIVDDIIQRRYLYSLTALTGHGKTAVALRIAFSIAGGHALGGRNVEQGTVVLLLGENPDDVRVRIAVMAEAQEVNLQDLPIFLKPGAFDLKGGMPAFEAELRSVGGANLIVIDSHAAFFDGDDENSNVQAGDFGRLLRQMCYFPGEPAVLALCHPTKKADRHNLLPRGGSAFLNEVDGNLCLWSEDTEATELHWQGKLRGPGFEPITFELERATSKKLLDAKGRPVRSVLARTMSEPEIETAERKRIRDEDELLLVMQSAPKGSFASWAEALGWFNGERRQPAKSRVSRAMERLNTDVLVEKKRGKWKLTNAGKKEADNASK